MKKLIHRYLDDHFCVKGDKIIYTKKQLAVRSDSLVYELNKVFELTKKQLKWYVKSWVWGQNKSFNFNLYWTPPISKYSWSTMPVIRSIYANIVAQELVRVQPMEMPSQFVNREFIYEEAQRVATEERQRYSIGVDPVIENPQIVLGRLLLDED